MRNTVNFKRKSRRRFFLLMRSRIPRISSEFRGGWGLNPPNHPPRYATECKEKTEVPEEKPGPLSLCLPQIVHRSTCWKVGTNRLRQGMAQFNALYREWRKIHLTPFVPNDFCATLYTNIHLLRHTEHIVLPIRTADYWRLFKYRIALYFKVHK